jgi:hypothetical protein
MRRVWRLQGAALTFVVQRARAVRRGLILTLRLVSLEILGDTSTHVFELLHLRSWNALEFELELELYAPALC